MEAAPSIESSVQILPTSTSLSQPLPTEPSGTTLTTPVINHSASQSQPVRGRAPSPLPIITSPGTSSPLRPAQPAFPARLQRQRTSNIATVNPEHEFQKTALNTSRSTIAQQESEIKRQKEALDIRNKRILQLEAQVTHASESVAARDIPTGSNDNKLQLVLDRLDTLENRILSIQPVPNPMNKIVINSCKPDHHTPVSAHNTSTQTEPYSEEASADESEEAEHETEPATLAL